VESIRSRIGASRWVEGAGRDKPELLISVFLVVATLVLIVNAVTFFSGAQATGNVSPKVGLVILTLNVALILIGMRRLVDVQAEVERRTDAERRAAHLATTDIITGLANRKGLADQAQALLAAQAECGGHMAVISLQLHRFKTVNDRYGYEVGDELLRTVGAAVQPLLPPDAITARLNGDEFAIVFPLARHETGAVEEISTRVLRRVTAPFELGGQMLQVGSYAGIASAEACDIALPDLLRRADIALERARSARAARPIWFDDGMEKALIAHVEIEQGIRYALDHEQFVPFFEPQVDLTTGTITGFEVLARWNHPLSGLILPEVFIPIAEEHGLIARLSEQVIANALAQAVQWPGNFSLSVNISPVQLTDPWLAQRLVRLLGETGFPAHRLVIEITESSLFEDIEMARSIVTSLKNQGVRLSLDDFGTGFSSLAHLRSLPFDIIKIDRSFTQSVNRDAESAAIVRAVTDLAKAIRVPIVVEGIEDAQTHAAVLGFGCAYGQGWYFGKPMNGNQACQLLDRDTLPAASDKAARRAS
jgi:diguanylate cyclase (GGDEF)-like protein